MKYSILVRYDDTLFCHVGASGSFKNIEFIFSYLQPVSKFCVDGNGIEYYSKRRNEHFSLTVLAVKAKSVY